MVSNKALTIILTLIFGFVHSGMSSISFKRQFIKKYGDEADSLFPSFYSAISILSIAPLVYFIFKKPGKLLYKIRAPWIFITLLIQAICAIIMYLGYMNRLDTSKITLHVTPAKSFNSVNLYVRSIYKWIRDPLLLTGLIIMWLTPFMTVNMVVAYITATAYLFVNSLLVERKLIYQFGDQFLEYKKYVPHIIPRIKNDSIYK